MGDSIQDEMVDFFVTSRRDMNDTGGSFGIRTIRSKERTQVDTISGVSRGSDGKDGKGHGSLKYPSLTLTGFWGFLGRGAATQSS